MNRQRDLTLESGCPPTNRKREMCQLSRCVLREETDRFIISNANMELDVTRDTGIPVKLTSSRKSFEWNKYSGKLELYDGLIDRHFSSAEHPAEMSVYVAHGDQPGVAFVRRFVGAEWTVRETFRAEEDAIHWEVEIVLDDNAPERSVEIRQLVPWPKLPWGWRVWAANFNFPSYTHNVAGLHLEYGDVCYGTVIPAVTIYNPGLEVGLAVAKPFGLPTPRLSFAFQDYRSEGFEVTNDLLGLRAGKPIRVAAMLRFHEGCFRPTLAWLLDKYPEYFLPGNPDAYKFEGGTTFGPPQVTEEDAAQLSAAGISWYEIHHSMPYFGEYYPKMAEWGDGSRPGQPICGVPTTHKLINDCGKILAKHDIASLLYVQVGGDAYMPVVGKAFPESLARDVDGDLYEACENSNMINSDPSLPFGKDMQRQMNGILERYPDISGVFVDQACYNMTDYAHDDGLTMYKNKPAYRLRFCYDKHLPDLCRRLHEQGKFIYSNGPYDIELQRGFDGNMAESNSTVAATMKYMHIAKPLLFFGYYRDEIDVEDMLRQCLLAGACWSVWEPTTYSWFAKQGVTHAQKQVFDRYLPLCRLLLGRRILLEPNPLVFSKRASAYAGEGDEVTVGGDKNMAQDWEIFWGRNGDILISLVSRRKSCMDVDGFSHDLRFDLRIPEAGSIARAHALGVDYDGESEVKIERKGDSELALTLPIHGAASLVVLKVNGVQT